MFFLLLVLFLTIQTVSLSLSSRRSLKVVIIAAYFEVSRIIHVQFPRVLVAQLAVVPLGSGRTELRIVGPAQNQIDELF